MKNQGVFYNAVAPRYTLFIWVAHKYALFIAVGQSFSQVSQVAEAIAVNVQDVVNVCIVWSQLVVLVHQVDVGETQSDQFVA